MYLRYSLALSPSVYTVFSLRLSVQLYLSTNDNPGPISHAGFTPNVVGKIEKALCPLVTTLDTKEVKIKASDIGSYNEMLDLGFKSVIPPIHTTQLGCRDYV